MYVVRQDARTPERSRFGSLLGGGQLKNQDAGEVSAKSDLVLEIYHPRSPRRDADPDGHTSTQGLSDVS